MKYLKIHIRSGDLKKGEHQMMYPDVYDAQEVEQVKIGPILYPNEIGKGAEEEDCVICFSDDIIANDYISLSGGEITELSAIDVDTYMTTRWEGRNDCNEKVIDIDRLLAIQVKKSLAIKLTAEDDSAMDPNNRVPGINIVNKDHNIFFHRFKVDNTP